MGEGAREDRLWLPCFLNSISLKIKTPVDNQSARLVMLPARCEDYFVEGNKNNGMVDFESVT